MMKKITLRLSCFLFTLMTGCGQLSKNQNKLNNDFESIQGTWYMYSAMDNGKEQFVLETDKITPEWFTVNVGEKGDVEIRITSISDGNKETHELMGYLEKKEDKFTAEFPEIGTGETEKLKATASLKKENDFLVLNFEEFKQLDLSSKSNYEIKNLINIEESAKLIQTGDVYPLQGVLLN